VVHGAHITSGLDPYGVSGLDLHLGDVIGDWANLLVPTEYTAQVFSDSSKIFSRASAILNRQ
jgi:hypothetical protein